MTLLTGWPSITDDSGNGTSGTILAKSVFDTIKSAIETLIHSTTNPTVTPEDIIDEVVTARGNLASLNARMSGVVDADGNPIAAAGTATTVQLQSQLASLNLAANADLASWSGGGSAAPDSFTLTGAGATIARTGAAMADTFTFGAGPYAAKITRAGTDADLTQTIIAAADWSKYEKAEGRMVVVGAWIKTSVASHARLVISDGATETNSSYHTGGGSSEFLTAVHTISSSATKLEFRCEVNSSNGDAYFGGFIFMFSNVAPSAWQYGSNIPLANATLAGIVSTAAQELAGVKSFKDHPRFEPGTSSGSWAELVGRFYTNTTSVGNVGAGEDDLMSTSVPADVLSADGRTVQVAACFSVNNNANAKTLKFYWNGVAVLTVALANVSNATPIFFIAWITRTGSNAQRIFGYFNQATGGGAGASQPVTLNTTGAGTDSGAIAIKFTATATTNDDIQQNEMILYAS